MFVVGCWCAASVFEFGCTTFVLGPETGFDVTALVLKGVGMIRAEIGLKNRQIINETYSFRCFLIL